ncbi:hypothetical protein ACJX0J_012769, partial [Zea mays]
EKIDKLVVPTTGFANESCGYRAFLLWLRNSEWQSFLENFEQPTHFHDTNKIGGLGVANLAIKNNGKWQEILKNKYFGSKSLTQIQGEDIRIDAWQQRSNVTNPHNITCVCGTFQINHHFMGKLATPRAYI